MYNIIYIYIYVYMYTMCIYIYMYIIHIYVYIYINDFLYVQQNSQSFRHPPTFFVSALRVASPHGLIAPQWH